MTARIVLLVTSPRVPAGLLSAPAWDLVRAHPVFAGTDTPQVAALRAADVPVTVLPSPSASVLLEHSAGQRGIVWLASPAGDPDLARELGLRLAREPGLAELELMYGSWDPPGARLLDAVAIIDRLVSPGGDPWLDSLAGPQRASGQAHQALARFMLEEAYEAVDAIDAGDLDALREELGDLLLQVVLHARLAEELPEEDRFTVDDVAGDLVDKMIRRNPHVFSSTQVTGLDEITENWEQIKRAEKSRQSIMDGMALAQPALALAAKVLSRVERAGLVVPRPPDTESLGAALLGTVAVAWAAGEDPEAELRRAVLAYAEVVRAAERALADRERRR